MNKLRWESYHMFDDESINSFWKNHFSKEHNILFILGKGFDVRMNMGLSRLIKLCPNLSIECLIIEFEEEDTRDTVKMSMMKNNLSEFETLLKKYSFKSIAINTWESEGKSKRYVGDKKANEIFKTYTDLEDYSDIIVDISALPKGVYFSLIGKLLTLLDTEPNSKNFFVSVAENVKIDNLILGSAIEDDLTYLFGYGGKLELESQRETPIIWFPILGESQQAHISLGAEKIKEDNDRLYEICPILPFPSKNPRRSDNLLIEYHELLFDSLMIESQNIMYTTERNPFQAYIQISKAISNYKESLEILHGCMAAVSAFSSKLLSIGALLTAYEAKSPNNRPSVGILNINSRGYKIKDEKSFNDLKDDSELFVTWLSGIPYDQKK